jgi:hypothetical protein
LGLASVKVRILCYRFRDDFRELHPNLCKFGVNRRRHHNLMEHGSQEVLLANKTEVDDDRSVCNDNHTPRIRSRPTRSL